MKTSLRDVDRATVVLGLFGTRLDAGVEPTRWNRWRPTVDICRQEDLIVDRLELLVEPKSKRSAAVVKEDLESVSPETKVLVHGVEMAEPWDFESVFDELLGFVEEYPFDLEREEYLVHITTGTHVAQICWFLLTESRHVPARLLQSVPPGRDPSKPGSYTVIDLDLSRYDRIATRFDRELDRTLSFLKSGIETRNEKFNQLMERIELVAIQSRAPILLQGPTGAGKSRLARRIYELKAARHLVDGPFVEVNCATVRGDGAASALFGHRRGAFTGAATDRAGLLRAADRGVLFLDELGELGLDEQTMLLRAIEEKRFLPLGSDQEVASDFQLITGTNRDLRAAVRAGTFREDLLARLDLWTFELPGLRDRNEDIEPNLDYELDQAVHTTGRKNTMTSEARQSFLGFATSPEATWNANFRDLNAAVTRMATLAPSSRITVDQVREETERLRSAWRSPTPTNDLLIEILGAEAAEALDRFEAVQLADVLKVCRNAPSLSAAGRELFSESRKRRTSVNDADRLRKYLARFGLDWNAVRGNP
ncbi:MAG: RNA repair transcriptional activator RtcR [Thermoanaerobaculia bacterium]|nr:RNA repair transcriptional activator RtcR [Thermoanaerobaculia bacterium]